MAGNGVVHQAVSKLTPGGVGTQTCSTKLAALHSRACKVATVAKDLPESQQTAAGVQARGLHFEKPHRLFCSSTLSQSPGSPPPGIIKQSLESFGPLHKPLQSGLPHIIEGALERQHPMTSSG